MLDGDTIVDLFRRNVAEMGERPALRRRVGDEWQSLSWAEYGQAVRELSAGLVELGIEPGESVGIFSWNRVEWTTADLAILAAGSVTVPTYPTSSSPQVAYVLGHSESRLCFVGDAGQLDKVSEVRNELPKLQRVVVFDADAAGSDPFVMTLEELRAVGAVRLAKEPALFEDRADGIDTESVATLVYTSGTTGQPKGTVITHGNIMATIEGLLGVLDPDPNERFMSFLPLSHIAERIVSHFVQIAEGGETWFASSLQTLVQDLPDCRPTAFVAVPRIWQKFHESIQEELRSGRGLSRLVVERYFALSEMAVAAQQGEAPRMALPLRLAHKLLDRLVGARVRTQLGLDQARILVSTAAPIHPSLVRWFHMLGLRIAEVYGQTEDCGPTTINPPRRIKIGTVGPPLPGLSLRIAEDGEILVRGGTVCRGYFKDRDATAELIDRDGWMHTGDVGQLDDDGYLRITDRKKDIIINAAGKNIAPQEIETRLRMEHLLSQALVVGDGRKYLVALLTLDPDALGHWANEHGKRAPLPDLLQDADLLAEVGDAVARANAEHAPVEQIKQWAVLPRDFTIEDDELTPTLKVKRRTIIAKHQALIEELYR